MNDTAATESYTLPLHDALPSSHAHITTHTQAPSPSPSPVVLQFIVNKSVHTPHTPTHTPPSTSPSLPPPASYPTSLPLSTALLPPTLPPSSSSPSLHLSPFPPPPPSLLYCIRPSYCYMHMLSPPSQITAKLKHLLDIFSSWVDEIPP